MIPVRNSDYKKAMSQWGSDRLIACKMMVPINLSTAARMGQFQRDLMQYK